MSAALKAPSRLGLIRHGQSVVINAALAGLVIVALATLEKLAGVWLALSPFRLGYGDPLRIVHVVIGALVVILSAIELWRSAKT